ncbi:MAG: hypothetical protein ABJB40_03775 [Acidobacteriota bacterium]
MYSTYFLKIFLLVVVSVTFVGVVTAQDNKPVEGQPQSTLQSADTKPKDARTEALRQLGLTREQFQQIRRLNAERKPLMEEAQKRLREANRALDEAIYADNVNDSDVQARLKDVHIAQAEVVRIRSMNELAVRRILTPDQLGHFRELRQRFEQAVRENVQNNSVNNNGGANRPFRPNVLRSTRPGLPQGRPVTRANPPRPNF